MAATVRTLQSAFLRREEVTVPVLAGKRGHPVLIPARYQPFLAMADPRSSLKDALATASADYVEVDVADAGVVRDVDVVEDLG